MNNSQMACMQILASGSYTTQIVNLKTILLVIAAAIGGVMLVYGIIQFAFAFKKMNQNGEHDAVMTIATGAVLVGGSTIIAALG
ncbi:MAG: hypothetical protein SO160_02340 [Lachnospiraceae bacterium]|nr:hypothetical protein [Lachnospiraceae bacterium]